MFENFLIFSKIFKRAAFSWCPQNFGSRTAFEKDDTVPNKFINTVNTSKYHHKLICKFAQFKPQEFLTPRTAYALKAMSHWQVKHESFHLSASCKSFMKVFRFPESVSCKSFTIEKVFHKSLSCFCSFLQQLESFWVMHFSNDKIDNQSNHKQLMKKLTKLVKS